MLEHCVGAHGHVVMGHVELVHGVELTSVETHLGHIVFGDVHFI